VVRVLSDVEKRLSGRPGRKAPVSSR